jgi:hypothetical protein
MSKDINYEHHQLADQFIQLANQMKDAGKSPEMVNAALMTASGAYTTFLAVGNDRALTSSGIKRVVEVYKRSLQNVQKIKQAGAAS